MYNRPSSLIVGILAIIGLMPIQIPASGAEPPELKAFPPAKEGMERFTIILPHKERGEEGALIPGKMMFTDGVNLMRLATTIEPRPLKGRGW